MKMLYMQGWSDTATYETLCRENAYDPFDRKVVFLFPGNSGHHGKNVSLFSIKSGAGLATAAHGIGKSGYPVLSLPTTTMENWENNQTQQAIVQKAIEDLYQAFGAGYSFMLPVRKHNNTKYFDHGLGDDELLEPSFWGGVQLASNKPLANHYIRELNKLSAFMALSLEERLNIGTVNTIHAQENNTINAQSPFYQAWLRGCNMDENDNWLKPVVKVTPKKPDLPKQEKRDKPEEPRLPDKETARPDISDLPNKEGLKKPVNPNPPKKSEPKTKQSKTIQLPASYETFFRHNETPADKLNNVREFLNDYTKNNSRMSRFFHGHWNRHHVASVHAIVEKIDNKTLETVEDVMKALKSIKLCNPEGSLARRIYCIDEKNPVDTEDNESRSQNKL